MSLGMSENPFSPNYSFVWSFERDFDYRPKAKWFENNWSLGIHVTTLYLIAIFSIQRFMTHKKPFKLKTPLILWNTCLALFSTLGATRTLQEMMHVLHVFGFAHSVCSNSYHTLSPVSSFWTFLFIISKLPELGDTVFVVLRKQKLLFLHYYHHVTVLLFTWYCYADESSTGRWYTSMNYVVHAFMYSYYALRAMGVRPPRQVAMAITSSQIVQMILGTYVTFYAYMAKRNGQECAISDSAILAGILMYFSYFVLFANFFRNSYLKSSNKSKDQ